MNSWLNQLVHASNGRYFTADEGERIVAYAESLPDRLAAAKRVEEAQPWLARHLGDAVGYRAADWGLPREPFAGDFARALTPVVAAMLLDDPDTLDEAVVQPFVGLAAALDVPAGDLGDLFGAAWAGLSGRLDAKSAGLLEPYFHRVAAGLRAADPAPVPVY